MRILAINHEFPPLGGGGANANYYIARELARQDHEVTVITSHARGLERREVVDGVEIIRLRCLRRNLSHSTLPEATCWMLRALPSAVAWARANRPDIVQAFFALPNGPVAWAAARAAGCPFVVRLGGGDVPENDPTRYPMIHRILMPFTRRVVRAAQAVIVNSNGLEARAREVFPGVQLEVIPNGVDLEEFSPPAQRRANGSVRLLCVARLIERKGLQHLLPALGTLRRDGYRFELRIVGDGPMRPQLERMVKEEGLAERVRIDGAVPHEELAEVYREADVFVLPSLAEGMPNVVLEALSSGLPVVGTRVAGMRELVREGENGWLVSAGDTEELRRALAVVLKSVVLTAEMGRASRRLAREMGWSHIARSYADIWEQILGRSRETQPAERMTAS